MSHEHEHDRNALTHVAGTYLAVPGKCVWDCPVIYRKPGLATQIELGLRHIPGLVDGRANFWTARVHIRYELDPEVPHPDFDAIHTTLARYVDQVVCVCVDGFAADERDVSVVDRDDQEAMAASAVQLGRELARLLTKEARASLESAARRAPEHQPNVIRLLQQVGAMMRQASAERAAKGEAEPAHEAATPDEEPEIEARFEAHAGPEREAEEDAPEREAADRPEANEEEDEDRDEYTIPGMPSLEPLVGGLARWLIDKYGEERVAELVEAAETRSFSGLLEGLLSGQTVGGRDHGTPPGAGLFASVIRRVTEVGALLRQWTPPPPSSPPPSPQSPAEDDTPAEP